MKIIKFIILFIIFYSSGYTQINVTDDDYNFRFSLNNEWSQRSKDETKNKDAVSYSFDRKDEKLTILLIAFKLENIKDLDDFIYTIEKDVNLNIPARKGDYSSVQGDNYKGKVGEYGDIDFQETIYYITTIDFNSKMNYAYMIRFICDGRYYSQEIKNTIKQIASSFSVIN